AGPCPDRGYFRIGYLPVVGKGHRAAQAAAAQGGGSSRRRGGGSGAGRRTGGQV
ncbi:hypothetical protein MNEG_10795, partial [Monoraphidium neglectum]